MPAYEECFGYTPLLGLTGKKKAEEVENLKKVKLKEHILLIHGVYGTSSIMEKARVLLVYERRYIELVLILYTS